MTTSIKGPSVAPTSFPNASSLRIGIVHARWNETCINPLVKGCVDSITKAGVKMDNIVIESVPGSWELPIACSRSVSQFTKQQIENNQISLLCLPFIHLVSPLPLPLPLPLPNFQNDSLLSNSSIISSSRSHVSYISSRFHHSFILHSNFFLFINFSLRRNHSHRCLNQRFNDAL